MVLTARSEQPAAATIHIPYTLALVLPLQRTLNPA